MDKQERKKRKVKGGTIGEMVDIKTIGDCIYSSKYGLGSIFERKGG